MKFKFLTVLGLILILSSCSSDDNTSTGDPIIDPTAYLPLETGNYWTYRVEGTNVSERDSLYVSNDTVINTKTYKKLKNLNQPFGFFSNSQNNNGLRKENDLLLLSGTGGINLGGAFPVDLSLNDFIQFKENAVANEGLSSVSGIINQDFQGYPLTLEYTMTSVALETLPNFTSPDSEIYTDVKKVKVILNLKVSITQTIPGFPFPITVLIMAPQDVVTSIQYYSKNIGMVYTTTTISYELQDFSQFDLTLPIPQSGSNVQEEFLDTFQVN